MAPPYPNVYGVNPPGDFSVSWSYLHIVNPNFHSRALLVADAVFSHEKYLSGDQA